MILQTRLLKNVNKPIYITDTFNAFYIGYLQNVDVVSGQCEIKLINDKNDYDGILVIPTNLIAHFVEDDPDAIKRCMEYSAKRPIDEVVSESYNYP